MVADLRPTGNQSPTHWEELPSENQRKNSAPYATSPLGLSE
jgi:hypothetical protein